ncbi:hypothetical protein PR048_002952 [Dryococelus australis]|uniref:Uncharacterized protein n=1 Tax=Dryococelus australis TaxID=614101 RepID=A0ABQ9ILL7_9NEOP|nr:hypothetical protein PR048_002952 [Dryococelus australis]
MSLCVRYFDLKEKVLKEDFLMFVPINDVTSKGLNNYNEISVCTEYLQGQGYDGASAMSGSIPPTALYVYCSSHALNLSVSDACPVPSIRNCMDTIKRVYDFSILLNDKQFCMTKSLTRSPVLGPQNLRNCVLHAGFNDMTL